MPPPLFPSFDNEDKELGEGRPTRLGVGEGLQRAVLSELVRTRPGLFLACDFKVKN